MITDGDVVDIANLVEAEINQVVEQAKSELNADLKEGVVKELEESNRMEVDNIRDEIRMGADVSKKDLDLSAEAFNGKVAEVRDELRQEADSRQKDRRELEEKMRVEVEESKALVEKLRLELELERSQRDLDLVARVDVRLSLLSSSHQASSFFVPRRWSNASLRTTVNNLSPRNEPVFLWVLL